MLPTLLVMSSSVSLMLTTPTPTHGLVVRLNQEIRLPCSAQERLQAAESFKSCSYQALGKILAEAPSEGRAATTTAMPSLQVGWAWMAVVRGRTGGAKKDPAVDYRGWWAGAACELMRAQVDRCGDGAWRRCYSRREISLLKSAQLRQQLEVVAGTLGSAAAARGFLDRCPVARRGAEISAAPTTGPSPTHFLRTSRCDDPTNDGLKLRFLRCAKEVEDSIGDLIVPDQVGRGRGRGGGRHQAACRAFQYLTGECHSLLKTCLGGGAADDEYDGFGSGRFRKDSILDRLNLPQDAKMRVELALLRQCLVAGGGL